MENFIKFPCSGCGSCCRRVGKAFKALGLTRNKKDDIKYFPYKWDKNGVCEMLTENNKCSVYDNRPTICNIDKMAKTINANIPIYYEMNIQACNKMMDDDGVGLEYSIK